MQETRDPAIRLFGQKIPLPGDSDSPSLSPPAIDVDKTEEEEGADGGGQESQEEEYQTDEDPEAEGVTEGEQEADPPPNAEEAKNSAIVNPETPSIEEEEEEEATKSKSDDKSEKEQQEQPQEKTLKKPDKVLPCPRCNSMDTKFCYYNNYNINQPRYFCKACQRYWTAGGTMRNVPVGAGRRKNKNSASHYRHITISEALQAAIIDAPPNGTQTHLPPTLKSNGRVLSFGLDAHAPICDSMASVLNLGEKKKVLNGTRNGYHHGLEDQRLKKNGDDHCSSGASSNITVSSSMPQPVVQNNGFLPQLPPCIPPPPPLPSVPWPYTWNSPIPPHALCPSGFPPMPFYPPPAFWNVPWYPSHSPKSPSSGPNSPTLGKHSRDGDMIKQEDPLHTEEEAAAAPKQRNGCVLVPKTLRIDDPNEAAKSSIWATLGIKNESVSGRGGSMFKAFQSKKEEKNHVEASPVLMANPAALSRSFNFHENS